MSNLFYAAACCTTFALLDVSGAHAQDKQHQITVFRWSGQAIDEPRSRKVLETATSMLNTDNPPGDYACTGVNLSFKAIKEIPEGVPRALNTERDLQAISNGVLADKPAIVVVNSIRHCGGPTTSAIGCGARGSAAVVVRYRAQDEDALAEANLWAHEFGHNLGLPHRKNTQRAEMYPSAWKDRDQVTEAECQKYRGDLPTTISGPAFTETSDDGGGTEPEFRLSVKNFVRQSWVEGIPYNMARGYTAVSVPVLSEMLRDPQEANHWGNIAGVLGAIGSPDAVAPLIGFLEAAKTSGDLTAEEYAAKTGVPVALGWSVFASGNRQAFDYLSQGAEPDNWRRRAYITWRAPYQRSLAERDQDLAAVSIVGLGLTGDQEARIRLAELAAGFRGKGFQTFGGGNNEGLSDNALDALAMNYCISSRGLSSYYKSRGSTFPPDQISNLRASVESHIDTVSKAAVRAVADGSERRPRVDPVALNELLSRSVECK